MTKARATRIIGRFMDGVPVSELLEALKLCGLTLEQLTSFRRAANAVTANATEPLASTELEALAMHGLDSDFDYDEGA